MEKTLETQEKEPVRVTVKEWDRPVYSPAVDIIEEPEQFRILLDTPGAHEKSVEVQLENNVLTVTARTEPENIEKMDMILQGRRDADYRRSFRLTAEVDTHHISASIKNGVLSITMPKNKAAQPRRIEVLSGK
jgi:HSP20 family molecular chaperone IbpA